MSRKPGWELAYREMREAVMRAHNEAIMKHGPLQGGMKRWEHHLMEECMEAVAEMRALDLCPVWQFADHREKRSPQQNQARNRMFEELAQVVQLAENMMIMLLQGEERKGQETWQEKSLSSKVDNGEARPRVSLRTSLRSRGNQHSRSEQEQ